MSERRRVSRQKPEAATTMGEVQARKSKPPIRVENADSSGADEHDEGIAEGEQCW